MEAFNRSFVVLSTLMLMLWFKLVNAVEPWAVTEWGDAHATFYGGNDASGTMGKDAPHCTPDFRALQLLHILFHKINLVQSLLIAKLF